jgi:hypothetical protein
MPLMDDAPAQPSQPAKGGLIQDAPAPVQPTPAAAQPPAPQSAAPSKGGLMEDAPHPQDHPFNIEEQANKVPGWKGAQDAFAGAQGTFEKSIRDPLGAAMNVEQSFARGTSTLAEDLGLGKGFSSIGHALFNSVHPDEGNAVVDRIVKKVLPYASGTISHIPIIGNLMPEGSGANKFFSMVGAQNAVDPVSWIPLANMAKKTIAATKLAQDMMRVTKAAGVTILGVKQAVKVGQKFQGSYEDHLGKEFHKHLTTRPELEADKDGKLLDFHAKVGRMRIEQKHITNMEDELGVPDRKLISKNTAALKDVKVANGKYELPHEIQQRYLQESWRYGSAEMRQQAEDLGYHPDLKGEDAHWAQMPEDLLHYDLRKDYQFMGNIDKPVKDMPAFQAAGGRYGSDKMGAEMHRAKDIDVTNNQLDRVKARLEMGRNFVRRRRVDKETEDFLKKFGGWSRNEPIDVSKLSHSGVRVWADSPLHHLSTWGKQSILASVLPHLINNMGTLTYFAGGTKALAKTALYMVKGPPPELVSRIKQAGGAQGYARDFEGILGSQIPGAKNILHFNQEILDRGEMAMRASLLEHFDKEMGPSKSIIDEYAKAQKIMDALGDYRNVSAVISMMDALGAPFASFAGITSKAARQVIMGKHAYRFAQPLRVQQAMNQDPDTFHGLQVPNPALKAARLFTGEGLTTPSVTGPVVSALGNLFMAKAGHMNIENLNQWVAENIQSWGGPVGSNIPAMFDEPYASPGRERGDFDPLGALIHSSLGEYFADPKSEKANKYIERDVDRAGGG